MDQTPTLQFFLGTKAQYIKTAPLLQYCDAHRIEYRLIDSGQHHEIAATMRHELRVREPDVTLSTTGDISTIPSAIRWSLRLASRLVRKRRLRAEVFDSRTGICIIHGDTPSTLLAALMAWRSGLQVAHLEAGLRSWNWKHPFPEELIRVAVMRWAEVLYVPNPDARSNVERMTHRGDIVELGANTTHEPLADLDGVRHGANLAGEGRVLVTCHRVENLKHSSRLDRLVERVHEIAADHAVAFVVHGPTRGQLEHRGLLAPLLDHPDIDVIDLLDHESFVRLLCAAPFVITDGGSIQEEAAVLGVPTLLYRARSERPDGLDANVVLSDYDDTVISSFLDDPQAFRRPIDLPDARPSVDVVEDLRARLARLG